MVEISSTSSCHDQMSWDPHRPGAKIIRLTKRSQHREPSRTKSREKPTDVNRERSLAIYSTRDRTSKVVHPRVLNDITQASGDEEPAKFRCRPRPVKKAGPLLPWFKLENYLPSPNWFEPRPTIDSVVGLTLHCFALSVVVLSRVVFKLITGLAHLLVFQFIQSSIENERLSLLPLSQETIKKSSIAKMGNIHLVVGKADSSAGISNGKPTNNSGLTSKCVHHNLRNESETKDCLSNIPCQWKGRKGKIHSSVSNPSSVSETIKDLTARINTDCDDVIISDISQLDFDVEDSDAAFELSEGSTVRLTLSRPSIATHSKSPTLSSPSYRQH